MTDLVQRLRADGPSTTKGDARLKDEAADKIDELRAVLRGIVDLGGTMGSALYAETVDRAARRALGEKGLNNADES